MQVRNIKFEAFVDKIWSKWEKELGSGKLLVVWRDERNGAYELYLYVEKAQSLAYLNLDILTLQAILYEILKDQT
jgi:hypothetical protein